MTTTFDHEKLRVYQEAVRFVGWVEAILKTIPRSAADHNQLDRASTSVPLNIAEGTGKFTAPDRCRFLDTARGSALECAACLDVLLAKGQITEQQAAEGKQILLRIVAMLMGFIKATSADRVYEDAAEYDL